MTIFVIKIKTSLQVGTKFYLLYIIYKFNNWLNKADKYIHFSRNYFQQKIKDDYFFTKNAFHNISTPCILSILKQKSKSAKNIPKTEKVPRLIQNDSNIDSKITLTPVPYWYFKGIFLA
jgi:hypothetical protein